MWFTLTEALDTSSTLLASSLEERLGHLSFKRPSIFKVQLNILSFYHKIFPNNCDQRKCFLLWPHDYFQGPDAFAFTGPFLPLPPQIYVKTIFCDCVDINMNIMQNELYSFTLLILKVIKYFEVPIKYYEP